MAGPIKTSAYAKTVLEVKGGNGTLDSTADTCMQELEKKLMEAKDNVPTSGTCKPPSFAGPMGPSLPSAVPGNADPFTQTDEVGPAVHQANEVQATIPTPEEQDDSLREGIRRCLHDPGFAAYVDRVEALWAEMEYELLDEMEYGVPCDLQQDTMHH